MAGKLGRRGNREGSVRQVRGRWAIRYYDEDGTQRERVTKAKTKREAFQLLRGAIDEVERIRGRAPVRTMTELKVYCERWLTAKTKSTAELRKRWAALEPHFKSVDVNDITSARLVEYSERRKIDGVAKSTINREAATLRRMLRIGARATPPIVEWSAIPQFEMADESDLIRTQFVEDEQWSRLQEELADHLRPLFVCAYWLGWRRGELLSLQRSQVDLDRGTIRLAPGSTKNKDGRLAYLPAEALAVLREQERATRAVERATHRLIPWVFHNRGERLRDYYTGWRAACVRAGCPGMRPHDFRRTAARNYTRAGVGEQVAMRITGHRTRHVFDRYNITAERDLAEAAVRVTNAKTAARKGRARDTGK